jgi:hypothetical protein
LGFVLRTAAQTQMATPAAIIAHTRDVGRSCLGSEAMQIE